MKRGLRFKKRTYVLFAAVAAVAAMASIGAYAYWTNGGTGSGTAAAGTADDNLVLSADGWAGIQPGQTDDVNIYIDNPNTYDSYVKNVVLDLTMGDGDGISTSDPGCDSGWFTYDYTSPNIDDVVADGAVDEPYLAAATLEFENSSTENQDACKEADITLHLVVDNS